MQRPVKASLAANVVESTRRACVILACVHQHVNTSVRVQVSIIAWGVYECLSCVFVFIPQHSLVLQRWLWNDGNRHYLQRKRGWQAGGRISHRVRTAAAPISLNSSQQPDPARGRQRSNRLLPLSLSFHHLPPFPCWQQNSLLSFFTHDFRQQLQLFMISQPPSFSSCPTLPFWFSHLFTLHLLTNPPTTSFLICLILLFWQFCITLSSVFSHKFRELRSPSFWNLLLSLQLISANLYRDIIRSLLPS